VCDQLSNYQLLQRPSCIIVCVNGPECLSRCADARIAFRCTSAPSQPHSATQLSSLSLSLPPRLPGVILLFANPLSHPHSHPHTPNYSQLFADSNPVWWHLLSGEKTLWQLLCLIAYSLSMVSLARNVN
jgi:hypothetical protein